MKTIAPPPDDPLLRAAVLAFASDYTLPRACCAGMASAGPTRVCGRPASTTPWFHRPACADEWLLHAEHSPAQGGRGLGRGRMYARDGVLVASVAQEGMVRVKGASRPNPGRVSPRSTRPRSTTRLRASARTVVPARRTRRLTDSAAVSISTRHEGAVPPARQGEIERLVVPVEDEQEAVADDALTAPVGLLDRPPVEEDHDRLRIAIAPVVVGHLVPAVVNHEMS